MNNSLKNTQNNLLIKSTYIEKLKYYGINCENAGSYQEILYMIESILNNEDLCDEEYEELDFIALELQELNYYQNTNK